MYRPIILLLLLCKLFIHNTVAQDTLQWRLGPETGVSGVGTFWGFNAGVKHKSWYAEAGLVKASGRTISFSGTGFGAKALIGRVFESRQFSQWHSVMAIEWKYYRQKLDVDQFTNINELFYSNRYTWEFHRHWSMHFSIGLGLLHEGFNTTDNTFRHLNFNTGLGLHYRL